MKETLLQLCQRLAQEKLHTITLAPMTRDAETLLVVSYEEMDEIIANTLKQAAEALEGLKVIPEHSSECLIVDYPEHCDCDNYVRHNLALTDAQKLIRGELDI